MEMNLQYYRSLPYTRKVERKHGEDEWSVYFLAEIEELPSLFITGRTRAEAMYNLDLAFDDYIESSLEWNDPIPEPERELMQELARQVALVPDEDMIKIETIGPFSQEIREPERILFPETRNVGAPIKSPSPPLPSSQGILDEDNFTLLPA